MIYFTKRNKIIKYVTCFIVYDNLMTLNVTVCEAISSFITEKSFNYFKLSILFSMISST